MSILLAFSSKFNSLPGPDHPTIGSGKLKHQSELIPDTIILKNDPTYPYSATLYSGAQKFCLYGLSLISVVLPPNFSEGSLCTKYSVSLGNTTGSMTLHTFKIHALLVKEKIGN